LARLCDVSRGVSCVGRCGAVWGGVELCGAVWGCVGLFLPQSQRACGVAEVAGVCATRAHEGRGHCTQHCKYTAVCAAWTCM
jgi:hypothetical protein